MLSEGLQAIKARVQVDHVRLDIAWRSLVSGGAKGSWSSPTLNIVVDGEDILVEIRRLVLSEQGVSCVVLGYSQIWPLEHDTKYVVSSRYFVCDNTQGDWSVRQLLYYYEGDDRAIEWVDLKTL